MLMTNLTKRYFILLNFYFKLLIWKYTFILYTVNRFSWRNQESLLIVLIWKNQGTIWRHFLRRRGGVKLTENPEKSLDAKCRNPNETMGGEFFSVSSGVLYHFPRVEPAFPSAKGYKGLKCLPLSYEIDGVIEQSGLGTSCEVNVYVTSRLNGGRKVCDYTLAWNHNSRMLIRRASIARVLDRVLSAAPVVHRAVNICRRVIISNRRTRENVAAGFIAQTSLGTERTPINLATQHRYAFSV